MAYAAAEMRAIVGRPGAVTLVAENSRGEVVAFVAAHRLGGGRAHVITLDVMARYRGRGVGKRLMLACEDRLRAGGARTVRLETAVSNRAAQSLYGALGYTCIKRLARYYPDGQDGWLMEKKLVRA